MTAPTRKIRVLIVDDSRFVRQAVARMLNTSGDIEVVGQAADGRQGIEKARELNPDVVTLDVQMPHMGGLETLERLMEEAPVPVLLLSSLTSEGAEVTLRGLELGALDFVDKSTAQGQMNLLSLAEELRAKIRALAGSPRRPRPTAPPAEPRVAFPSGSTRALVVAIGTSTGGPTALQAVIPRLPKDFGAAVLVVQHIPVGFTRYLAERLAQKSALPVEEARDRDTVTPGRVLIAPGGLHMKLVQRGDAVEVRLDEEPSSSLHRPSADVLMASVAEVFGSRSVGVVLTGMGTDGAEGLSAIRRVGGRTLAESEETCVIYGMPKAAIEAGVVDRAVPLPEIADAIVSAV
jgi:two-component system, chemotaxis family, protein-glutamate methylesterase/glutaminase